MCGHFLPAKIYTEFSRSKQGTTGSAQIVTIMETGLHVSSVSLVDLHPTSIPEKQYMSYLTRYYQKIRCYHQIEKGRKKERLPEHVTYANMRVTTSQY